MKILIGIPAYNNPNGLRKAVQKFSHIDYR